jgi:cysteine desulfurase
MKKTETMQIYLDYSATTPPRPESIAAIHQALSNQWGNPSSLHSWGERSALLLESARLWVAQLIGGQPESIVFTASGTESDNLAIMGIAQKYDQPRHLIISSVEHSAVSQPAAWLEAGGWRVTRLPVDSWGRVNPVDLENSLDIDTVLVSVIHGQSEVGTVQPIAQLAAICQRAGVIFHTDAVQTAGRLPIEVQAMGIDLLSLSSHKIYGGGGVGALYVKPGLELQPLLRGGGQEGGWRSGTPPIAQIAGFGVAAKLIGAEMAVETTRQQELRDHLHHLLAHTALQLTGHPQARLPHHLSFIAPVSGRQIVRAMNLAGIGISAGSACHSGKSTPSAALLAMGWNAAQATCGIRLTLGRETSRADVEWAALALGQVLDRLAAPV